VGEITYNGYRLDEFVPRKTASYISQNNVHTGEMTVKETLDFSVRFQGVGARFGNSSHFQVVFIKNLLMKYESLLDPLYTIKKKEEF